jgi:aminoglycoside phosphotransferase (APT) family kinase protein
MSVTIHDTGGDTEGVVLARSLAAVAEVCRTTGLNAAGARLLRDHANMVYHLPAERAVLRLAETTRPGRLERLVCSVRVTRWLAEHDFPTVRPLEVTQPVAAEGYLVTFWHYEEPVGPLPDPVVLGATLRRLHALPPVPFDLPTYDPFGQVRRAVHASRVLADEDREWLLERCSALADSYYERLEFGLPYGLIHGDAHRGNLLRTPGRLLLCDWDSVSAGPREVDLIPTLQGVRFGLTERQRSGFSEAYGYDATAWDGYPVLRDMRELQTLTAVLRNAHRDPRAHEELILRLASLREGDDRGWNPF